MLTHRKMAAEPTCTLYQYPMSYFTQKVLLALYEKKIDFKSVYVNLLANEQLQEWYYKLHPDGKVPLFQDGDKLIPESDDIIDYLEKLQPEPCLVPSTDTDVGKDVAKWRSQLTSQVPIELITYGVFYNPELSATGLKSPVTLSKQEMDTRMAQATKELTDLASKNPDMKESVDRKLGEMDKRKEVLATPEKVKASIDSLQAVFDNVESKLKEGGDDGWLCGSQYSAADITLTVLINRLILLGLDSLFITDKRPLVAKFWEKAQARKNLNEMREFVKKIMQEQAAKQKK